MLIGVSAVIISLLGCCTSKTKDRCSVCCFAFISFIVLALYGGVAYFMLILQTNDMGYIENACKNTPITEFSISEIK